LTAGGVRIEFVKQGLAFTGEDSPMTTLLLAAMGALAEFERALIRAPTGGNRPARREYGISRETLYQYLRHQAERA
jgi:DNA invertase Pin-like site-specific DNA recombinase